MKHPEKSDGKTKLHIKSYLEERSRYNLKIDCRWYICIYMFFIKKNNGKRKTFLVMMSSNFFLVTIFDIRT